VITLKYRPEIDGLRALAVVPVIFFHAGFKEFRGGFVGVDIFFVISGYLITTIIINELDAGNFSIIRFYERRARRILPALFFVMLACLPFSWAWLMPRDLVDFAKSIVSVSTFSSNILFWRQSGYFDTAAELKPLLHTWSLAVEEQYYILFPLFLMFSWRLGRRNILALLAIAFCLSLGLAQWGAYNKPSATFYLLLTRGWELLVGGFCAFYLRKHAVSASPVANNIGSSLGFALIVSSIYFFDKQTPFPSLYALVPTLGTALVILYTVSGTGLHRLLSTRVFVGVGLISYSAYLWHQPLFAIVRHRSLTEVPISLMAVLCVLTFPLAYLCWRFVEKPFRGTSFPSRYVFPTSVVGLAAFCATGLWIIFNDGFERNLTPYQKNILTFENYPRQAYYREGSCFLWAEQKADVYKDQCIAPNAPLLWGDSHAAALYPGLSQHQAITQYTAGSCPPLIGVNIRSHPNCTEINDFVMRFVSREKPHTIYLHATWTHYSPEDISNGLQKTIAAIIDESPSIRIVVIGGVPQWGPQGLPSLLARMSWVFPKETPLIAGQKLVSRLGKAREFDRLLAEIVNGFAANAKFVSLIDALCDQDACVAFVDEDRHVVPISWDYGHLTKGGSVYISGILLDRVER